MYRMTKAQGHTANVVIENTETLVNLNIGKVSIEMLNILEESGHKISRERGEGGLVLASAWNIEISKETATALSSLAMQMKKPIRDQRKWKPKKDNKHIDAMDVLLGLASYN